jgi:hypothetical protein
MQGAFVRIQRFLLAASLAAPSAFAETTELTNGDRLSGEVIERTLDGVVIEHPMLGRITLAADPIEPAKQANPGLFGTDFMQGWTREIPPTNDDDVRRDVIARCRLRG